MITHKFAFVNQLIGFRKILLFSCRFGIVPATWVVLRLDMVDKSTSLSKPTSGWMFVIGQSGQAFSSQSEAPSASCCWHFQQPPRDMILHPHLASMPLKRKPLAMGKRAPNAPSIVGWFFPLPWLAYAGGSVGYCPTQWWRIQTSLPLA